MPGRGFAPRNPDIEIEVAADGKVRGPELPPEFEWPEPTVSWWETWRRSAQAVKMTDTDWDFMLDTARLHAIMWLGNSSLAAEVRLRVAKFGATFEDRNRLKMAIVEPETKAKRKPAAKSKAKLRVVDTQAS